MCDRRKSFISACRENGKESVTQSLFDREMVRMNLVRARAAYPNAPKLHNVEHLTEYSDLLSFGRNALSHALLREADRQHPMLHSSFICLPRDIEEFAVDMVFPHGEQLRWCWQSRGKRRGK